MVLIKNSLRTLLVVALLQIGTFMVQSTWALAVHRGIQLSTSSTGCMTPQLGGTVQLTCTARGALMNRMNIAWYSVLRISNGCGIKLFSRRVGRSSLEIRTTSGTTETNATLTITNFGSSLEGVYFCQLTDALHPGLSIQSTVTEIKLRHSPPSPLASICNRARCTHPFICPCPFTPADICTEMTIPTYQPPALIDIDLYKFYHFEQRLMADFSIKWESRVLDYNNYLWHYRVCEFSATNVPHHYKLSDSNTSTIACTRRWIQTKFDRSSKHIKWGNVVEGKYYIVQVKRIAKEHKKRGGRNETIFTSAALYMGAFSKSQIPPR
jgi:hypothetical protein